MRENADQKDSEYGLFLCSAHKQTYIFMAKFFFVYWLDFYITAKDCSWIRFHLSLYLNSHYQVIFTNFDLKTFCPLPYLRDVWHVKKQILALLDKQLTILSSKKHFLTLILMGKFLIWTIGSLLFSIVIFRIKPWLRLRNLLCFNSQINL